MMKKNGNDTLYILKSVIHIIAQYLMPSAHMSAMNVFGLYDGWVMPRMYMRRLEEVPRLISMTTWKARSNDEILAYEALFNDLAAAYLSLPYRQRRTPQLRAEKVLTLSMDRFIILYPSTVAGYTTRGYVSIEACIIDAIRRELWAWGHILSIPRHHGLCDKWRSALDDAKYERKFSVAMNCTYMIAKSTVQKIE